MNRAECDSTESLGDCHDFLAARYDDLETRYDRLIAYLEAVGYDREAIRRIADGEREVVR